METHDDVPVTTKLDLPDFELYEPVNRDYIEDRVTINPSEWDAEDGRVGMANHIDISLNNSFVTEAKRERNIYLVLRRNYSSYHDTVLTTDEAKQLIVALTNFVIVQERIERGDFD